jgi:DNA-directed RNA polymerase specialized sigma24 family protein
MRRWSVEGIMGLAPPGFVDETGQPLGSHIQEVLRTLAPRLRRDFPTFQDDAVVAEILEEAGRRIADAERRLGRLEELYGYAWVAIRSVATSRMRLVSFAQATLELAESTGILAATRTTVGTPEEIEREILLREIMAMVTPDEQRLILWKRAGFSSQEIGVRLGIKAEAVDVQLSRLRKRIRDEVSANTSAAKRNGPRAIGRGQGVKTSK